jgi:hypothetical protein
LPSRINTQDSEKEGQYMIKWKNALGEIMPATITRAPLNNYGLITIRTEDDQECSVYIESLKVSDGGYIEVETELNRLRKEYSVDNVIDLDEVRERKEPSNIDYDEVFHKTGSKFKYAFAFGYVAKPQTIEVIDSYTDTKLSPAAIEKQKQQLSQQLKLPFIGFEMEEL